MRDFYSSLGMTKPLPSKIETNENEVKTKPKK